MKRYHTYKDSGIEWLGEIPEHWKILRIKDLIKKIGSGVTPKGGSEVYVEKGIPLIRSQNVYDDGLRIDAVSFIDEATHNKMKNSQIQPNDILVNITGASIGRSCVVPTTLSEANINQHIIYMRFKKQYVNFVGTYFKTSIVKEYINLIQAGSSKEALTMGQALYIPLILPPFPEQTAIVQYLDSKTQAIDQKTRLLQKKIDYYKELRQSIINDAVTKGLDNNVALKESGIDWIGQIPEHWEVKRGKDALEVKYGIPLNSKLFTNNPEQGYPMIRIRDILKNTVQTYYEGNVNTSGLIDNGAILIGMDGDFNIARWSGGKALLNQRICEINTKGDRDYLFYYLPLAINIINQIKHFTTVKHLSDVDLKEVIVVTPPKKEQTAIAQHLDQKTHTIDQITSNIQKQITALKELRKTLINEVVTGKKRVYEPKSSAVV